MILATKIIIIAVFLIMVGYDIFAVIKNKKATISRVIADWSKRFMMIPFTMSVLTGHFFWTQSPGYSMKLYLLIASGVIVLTASIFQIFMYKRAFFKPFYKIWYTFINRCLRFKI